MGNRLCRAGIRGTGSVLCGLLVAVAGAAPASATHPGRDMPDSKRTGAVEPTTATAGGGRTGDYTTDGVPDVLARGTVSGKLKVFPHSGAFGGTKTFRSPVTVGNEWHDARWIGQGDLNGDGNADVLRVSPDGRMTAYPHTGTWDGTKTLGEPVVLGNGWQDKDLITTADFNGDQFEDVIAHRRGTGKTFVFENNGGIDGTNTLAGPQLLTTGPSDDKQQLMADLTGDGLPDLIAKRPGGALEVFSFRDGGTTHTIGYGWDTVDAIAVTEVNGDGAPDILGVRDGALLAYRHSGSFDGNDPLATLTKPVEVVAEWAGHDMLS